MSSSIRIRNILILGALGSLSACAYTINDSIQDITIVTPGAMDAECDMYVDGFRHKAHPPQTLTISTAKETMKVDCKAPGNRRKVVYIEPSIDEAAKLNATNAGVGLLWDLGSGALYKYPDIVEISFKDTPVRAESLPSYNNPDIIDPDSYQLEEFKTSFPRMNSDRLSPPNTIMKRGQTSNSSEKSYNNDAYMRDSEPIDMFGKGDLTGKNGSSIPKYPGD